MVLPQLKTREVMPYGKETEKIFSPKKILLLCHGSYRSGNSPDFWTDKYQYFLEKTHLMQLHDYISLFFLYKDAGISLENVETLHVYWLLI